MDVTVIEKKKIEVKYLLAECSVRYWEDGTINGIEDEEGKMPCKVCDVWKPLIDVDTGVIVNWTQGVTAFVHYKVCDAGVYSLLDESKDVVKTIDGCYVPEVMCPSESGYGDYVIMNIDADGLIDGWDNSTLGEHFDECFD